MRTEKEIIRVERVKIARTVFYSGIILDLLTTMIGYFLGVKEAFTGGFLGVFVLNALVLVTVIVLFSTSKEEEPIFAYMIIPMALIGLFRMFIGVNQVVFLLGISIF